MLTKLLAIGKVIGVISEEKQGGINVKRIAAIVITILSLSVASLLLAGDCDINQLFVLALSIVN